MTWKNPKIARSLHILGRLKACVCVLPFFALAANGGGVGKADGCCLYEHFHCSKTIRLRDITRYVRIKSLPRVLSALMCSKWGYARASLVPRCGESVRYAVSNRTRICIWSPRKLTRSPCKLYMYKPACVHKLYSIDSVLVLRG